MRFHTEFRCNIKGIATLAQPAPAVLITKEPRLAPEYFPALTGLRFFLALWVILHHLVSKGMMLEMWTQSLPTAVGFFFEQGHVAVRTFFVLSGFVLTQGYAQSRWRRRDLISYGVARFARIYPVYLVSLAVVSYFILEFLMSPDVSAAGKAETLGAYLLVLQGWMKSPGAGWNTPAWSLSCEFVFYLCLPALLIWLGRRDRWRLAVMVGVGLVWSIVLKSAGVPFTWKPVLHLGDFLMGIATARIYGMLAATRWRRGAWFYLPAIAAGILVTIYPDTLPRVIDLGTALRPLNGLLVLGLALGGGTVGRFLSSSLTQYLGQASYSMYILHVPLLWWFGNRGPRLLPWMASWAALVYITGIILISAACFEWIEKPANRGIRRWVGQAVSPAARLER